MHGEPIRYSIGFPVHFPPIHAHITCSPQTSNLKLIAPRSSCLSILIRPFPNSESHRPLLHPSYNPIILSPTLPNSIDSNPNTTNHHHVFLLCHHSSSPTLLPLPPRPQRLPPVSLRGRPTSRSVLNLPIRRCRPLPRPLAGPKPVLLRRGSGYPRPNRHRLVGGPPIRRAAYLQALP